MATLLRMPEVAANATHATLAAWSKKEGEPIAVGDCLAEVETDKAIVEISADGAAVMGQWLVQAGQEGEVGAPLAVLLAAGGAAAAGQALLLGSAEGRVGRGGDRTVKTQGVAAHK